MKAPRYPDDEARVVRAFADHLVNEGWTVVRSRPSINEADVVARDGAKVLVAEVKGRTAAARTDVDTMYGQLLRRIASPGDADYAVVVPTEFVSRALEVSPDLRHGLRIRVFEVTADGHVIEHH